MRQEGGSEGREDGRLYHALPLLGCIQARPLGEAGRGGVKGRAGGCTVRGSEEEGGVRGRTAWGGRRIILIPIVPSPGKGWLIYVPSVPFIWGAYSPLCARALLQCL